MQDSKIGEGLHPQEFLQPANRYAGNILLYVALRGSRPLGIRIGEIGLESLKYHRKSLKSLAIIGDSNGGDAHKNPQIR